VEQNENRIMKRIYSLALLAATGALLVTRSSPRVGEMVGRIESSNLAQKERTTEYAQDVEGVKEVKSEMKIAEAPAKPDKTTGEKLDDASITAQVKSSLMSHRSTSALKTNLETTDGVVTVGGLARNATGKSLVTKLVPDLKGATSVINNLTMEAAGSNINHRPRPVMNLKVVNK
jgi:hyperosmotically inducible periplasmic protein